VKNHYISEYLKLKCSGQLQELFSQSSNPWKEVTESMSAYKNVKEFIDVKDGSITNIFIGDGSLCLTGALFSFITKGQSVSIDPKINMNKVAEWQSREKVKRLLKIDSKFQNIPLPWDPIKKSNCNLILVHAHVNLEELVSHFPNWNMLFTNPCCNPFEQTFSVQFQKENDISVLRAGYDKFNLSPKNMVFVYKNNKSEGKKPYQLDKECVNNGGRKRLEKR